MQKLIRLSAIALAAALAACSHGGNGIGTPPLSHNTAGDAQQQKMLRETQHVPSSFTAPKHPGFLPAGAPVQKWPSGIAQSGEAPVPGGMFDIVNQYNATEHGEYITVYAGSRKDTGEGIVLVVTRSTDLQTANAQTYHVAASAVRIAGVQNGTLQLETISGPSPETIQFHPML